MANGKRNAIIKNQAFWPESDIASDVNVRITHRREIRECYGELRRQDVPRGFIARFHAKYQQADGCWLWQAGKFAKGYGMVSLGRFADRRQHTEYAHRVAYVLAKGDIPQGSVVMHTCDVRACVNPDHLVLGTQADNVRDAATKGHYSVPHAKGSVRKLTEAQVAHIRCSPMKGVRLAEMFGVSKTTVSLIRRGLRRKAA